MTASDTLRHTTDVTMDGARHAARVVGPYAASARSSVRRHAGETRHLLAPRVEQAREALPPRVGHVIDATALCSRRAADYTVPRVGHAVATARAAAEPRVAEAVVRGSAAAAALRHQVTAEQIERLARSYRRRSVAGRIVKGVTVVGLLGAAAYAGRRWWTRQTDPDWLVEPPAPTEMADRAPLSGSSPADTAEAAGPRARTERTGTDSADRNASEG